MTAKEFLEQIPVALQRTDETVRELRGRLETWLVTFAVGLMAVPTLLGNEETTSTFPQWTLLTVAYALLVVCIASVFGRYGLAIARLQRGANWLEEARQRIESGEELQPEQVEADRDHQRTQVRSQTCELWFLRSALTSFLLGAALLAALALVKNYPAIEQEPSESAASQIDDSASKCPP